MRDRQLVDLRLVERPLPFDVPQARVPSVRAVLGPVAASLYGNPSADLRTLGLWVAAYHPELRIAPPYRKCAGSPRTADSTIALIGPTNWFMPRPPSTVKGKNALVSITTVLVPLPSSRVN